MPSEAITAMSHATEKVGAEIEVVENVRREIADYDNVVAEARRETEDQQSMTLREGLRRYPKAAAWSMLLSTAIIMEGFDVVLLGSFYALPQFNKKYGVQLPDGKYTVTAPWQAGLSNGAQVGEIIGLCINGWASERFGYKKTMLAALASMICFIFIPFFANNVQTLLAGEILQGIPWGVFQTLTTAYAAEVTPVALRPYLTAYVNLCWVLGQVIASGVLRGMLTVQTQWAYRIPFALQWIWPLPILIGTIFAPESPWWLVRKGRNDDARRQIRRLHTNPTEQEVDNQLSLMVHTNALEKSIAAGTSYFDCFKGVDLRRTEIAAGAWMIQNLCGSAFMGYSTFFLEQSGVPVTRAFDLSIGQYAIGAAGTLSSWFLMRYFGRRSLYLFGLIFMVCALVVIGGMGCIPSSNTSAQAAIGAMLLVYTAVYDSTVGPVCCKYSLTRTVSFTPLTSIVLPLFASPNAPFVRHPLLYLPTFSSLSPSGLSDCLVAEISSTRLRAKTVVIARVAYNIIGIVNSIIMPYFLNTTALNWGSKTGFFWAGLCAICLIWTYFRVPEPKGRTYGELDVLFENRVSARKFRTTAADQFAGHGMPQRTSSNDEKDEKFDVQHVEL